MRTSALTAALGALLALVAPHPAYAGEVPERVVIVSMPGVSWEDVARGRAPNLEALAGSGAVAALSLRTVGSRTDLASAYATIGAGNRAAGHDLLVTVGSERMGEGQVRGFRRAERLNEELRFGSVVGSLGEELRRAGLRTSVIGNADGGVLLGEPPPGPRAEAAGPWHPPPGVRALPARRRFTGIALADTSGRLPQAVADHLLAVEDPSTVSGVRGDPEALVESFRRQDADVVLVETSDTFREGQVLFSAREGVGAAREDDPARVRALERDDLALGLILQEIDLESEVVLVLGTTGPGPGLPERLTIAVAAGAGIPDGTYLTSPTTRRAGLIALVDVGPAVLAWLGLERPAAMSGRAFEVAPGRGDRIERLAAIGEKAAFHDRWVGGFFVIFVLLQIFLYAGAWRLPTGGSRGRRAAAVRGLALGFMAAPAGTFLIAASDAHRWGWWGPTLVIAVAATLLVAGSLGGPWRHRPSGPPAFICGATVLLIAGDLLAGAPLQISSLIGYSPVVAGRFYGIGNLSFAVFGTAAILLVAAVCGSRNRRSAVVLIAATGAFMLVLEGAPALGADFGGVIAILPAFGVLGLLVAGREASWRTVLILTAGGVLIALGIALLDSMRPPSAQTHMGRFAERIIGEGLPGVWEVLVRKAQANLLLLTRSVLGLTIPVAVLFVLVGMRRGRDRLRSVVRMEPGLKAGLIAAGVMNAIGFVVNDSGIAIPAMGLAVAVPYLLATVLHPRSSDLGRSPP